jgi:two-component system sensor histidine kinase MprB
MSIRWQIALALAAVAAAVGAAAGVGGYVTTGNQLRASVDESLQAVADRVTTTRTGRGHDGNKTDCPSAGELAPASDVQIVDDGDATHCLSASRDGVDLPSDAKPGYRTVDDHGDVYRVLIVTTDDGYVQVARSMRETDDILSRLRLRLLLLVSAGATVALAAGWAIARGIARPIVRLRSTAESIADSGDLDTPVPVSGPSEVRSLGTSFTAMVAALARSRDQQRRLVDDASHEMRTPLTSLRTNLEHLEHVADLPEAERTEVLDAVQLDVAELTNLLSELVELATDRADDEEPEVLSLAAVAGDVAQRTARRSGRSIVVQAAAVDDAPSVVLVRPHLAERAISNLLDNAVKYAPGPDDIEVVVGGGRLEVRDHGPGIAAEDLPHVFDRFYRATAARTAPGSGLGLSIVRQIAERHGGTAFAGPRPDGRGSVVGFELPVLEDPDGPERAGRAG